MVSKYSIVSAKSANTVTVFDNNQFIECSVKGKLKISDKSIKVGDHVLYEKEQDKFVINKILDRKNDLIKPSICNIDYCFIVSSSKTPDFNLKTLLRQILFFNLQNIKVEIIISKSDLIDTNLFKSEHKFLLTNYNTYFLTKQTINNVEFLKNKEPNSVILFSGNSGVGKSTILKTLLPEVEIKTDVVSNKLQKGKQTTTFTKLYPYNQFLLSDTPGFSEINFSVFNKNDIEFFKLDSLNLKQCKFSNCKHDKEIDCNVKLKVEENPYLKSFYEVYLQALKEAKNDQY